MRRDLGSWAGNQAEVSKGAGTGQGHKQLLRSVQDAGPVWEAGAGASLGATPGPQALYRGILNSDFALCSHLRDI